MKTRFTILFLGICLLGWLTKVQAQSLGFSIGSTTAPPGDTIQLPIIVTNFDSISGYQGTLSWDTTLLTYIEINNPTAGHSNIIGNPGQGAIPLNAATFLWADFSGGSQTYADSTSLLAIRFAIDPNAPQGITNVLMNGNVTPLGYTQGGGLLSPTVNPGLVNINGCLPTADPGFSFPATVCLNGTSPLPSITGDTGGAFSVNNGALIDSLTGQLDLNSVAADSTYLITYQVGSPCPAFGTQQVQILPADDASFLLVDSTCASGPAPSITITGIAGGTFSIDNGALINAQTGLIDLTSTQAGQSYSVTYGTNGACPASASETLFILPDDDTGFMFPDTVCVNAQDPVATITGLAGGIFSVNQGATIDSATGQLDMTSVAIGTTYQVSYLTNGPCPAQLSLNVFIEPPADASFTFPANVCPSGSNPLPVITGSTGGTFSVSPAATIDSLTGELDLSSTTNGQTYTITYSLTADCPGSSQQTVTVEDQDAPVLSALPALNGSCDLQIPVPTAQDNCAGTITGTTTDPTQFTLNGTYTVNWTFDDGNGNAVSAPQTIVILDTELPQAICQNLTVQLDTTGQATITPSQVDDGSFDNCGISQLALSQTTFTSADLGVNAVILTVTDVNGNVNTCAAVVTIIDFAPPQALCLDATIYLNAAGEAVLDPNQIDGGSTVGAGTPVISVSQTQFGCEDVGPNFVTFYIEDSFGIIDSCESEVTVLDTLAPFPLLNNATLYLDANGEAVLTVSDVDQGSVDACGLQDIILAQDSFSCDYLGTNIINLTLTDVNGNSRLTSTGVTVLDTIAPTAVCEDLTIALDSMGMAVVDPNIVGAGSFDVCGIDSTSLSQDSFTQADLGENEVVLTVFDESGNQDSCMVSITVTGVTSNRDLWALSTLSTYPNPVQDLLQISWESQWTGEVEIVLFNQVGQAVMTKHLNKFSETLHTQLHLAGLAKGVYALHIQAGSGRLSKRIIVE